MLSFHPYLLKVHGRTPVKQTKNETLGKAYMKILMQETTIILTLVNEGKCCWT